MSQPTRHAFSDTFVLHPICDAHASDARSPVVEVVP